MENRSLFDPPPRAEAHRPAPHDAPLAEQMRPAVVDDLVGLEEITGPGKFLRTAIETDRIPSLILWGPPGSGKTTLARIIARSTRAVFVSYSAVTSGIKEIKTLMDEVRRRRTSSSLRTVVFIDEIHRFNRAQQDAFLPYVEAGDITLIGATTENPSFEVNSALLSRCRVVVLPSLSHEALLTILTRGTEHPLVQATGTIFGDGVLDLIASLSGGDARQAINSLQVVAEAAAQRVGTTEVKELLQRRSLAHDKSGDSHYNLISALHKSVRNGDADAAVYWLVRMLEGGEDPMFVTRRLVRAAAEDIGLADPSALQLAVAAKEAVHFIGMPECGVVLAELVIYLAQAPKSNSAYEAWRNARREVMEGEDPGVPLHLRNAPTKLMRDLGYGAHYEYAHDFENQTAPMNCLPESLSNRQFYHPRPSGFEKEIGSRLEGMRKARKEKREERKEE